MYVEPVYLRAEKGELPELTRVIVAYDNLDVNLVRSALDAYNQAQQALKQGNWQEYGRYQQQLQDILQELNQ